MFDFNFVGDELKLGRACNLRLDDENWYTARFLPSGSCHCDFVFIPANQQYGLIELLIKTGSEL